MKTTITFKKKANLKISQSALNEVKSIIAKHRLVSDRENELIKKGYLIIECSMGSGGTGQIKTLKSEIRMQIGYGHSRYNYAKCVVFKF